MKKCFITILLILFNLSFAFTQEKINFPNIDKKTYLQYLDKDWTELIKTGKLSLKNNIDFYYLQVRMGIAYYELRKYTKAVKCFEIANAKNSEDELIQEYLYFSYIFSSRYEDARVLEGTFKRELKEKLNISAEYPFISAINIETKHEINEDYKYLPKPEESVYQKAVLNQTYYNISLEHKVGRRITIFHGYSYIGILNNVLENDISLPLLYNEDIKQNEYYLSLNAQIGKGLNLSAGFHYINTNYFALNPIPPIGGGIFINNLLYDFSENSYAGAINISKHFSVLRISGGTSVSNLNQEFQIQPEISVKVFPFGSSNFFTESKAIYLIENDGVTTNQNPIFKQSLGISFLKYSWFVPSFTYGNQKNFTEYNVFIANNDVDLTKMKYEGLLNLGLAKGKFNIFFKYQYNIKENKFEINDTDYYKEYINNSITGGINWQFNKY